MKTKTTKFSKTTSKATQFRNRNPHTVLPKGILKSDLKEPSWKSKVKMAEDDRGYSLKFEIWYCSYGWCIPTLLIAHSRRANQGFSGGDRTYAVAVNTGSTLRVGNGPHIKARHTVYVKASRLSALQKFVDLQRTGAEDANTVRDRISTRRARGAMRSWY
jgi:hypothetical protein